ncbi:MAG: choice-of-anchor Q domain-containing protein [Dokdonella sp.]
MSTLHRLFAASLLVAALPASAATYTVTRGDDPLPNGCTAGDCSLREALAAAVVTPAGDTIVLASGQYTVTRGELSVVGDVSIEGVGADDTRIVGNGNFNLLHVTPLGSLVLDGVMLSSQGAAVDVDSATAMLRGVRIAAGGGIVTAGADSGPANLRIEHSELGDAAGCNCGAGSFRAFYSTLNAALMFDGTGDLELDHVDVVGPSASYGVAFSSAGSATIRDSTITHHAAPLVLDGNGGDVHVVRTRFAGNVGPMFSYRDSTVWMDEVEFRDNVVDDAHLDNPAVLLAQDVTAWRISRALFTGNRGGNGSGANQIGSTVRVLAGGNVVMGDVTFVDNTFRAGVVNGVGHAIGVDVADTRATLFWLLHATMRTGPSVPLGAVASLLAVRGSAANVRIYNSLMQGTCAFAGGATIFQAVGNFESPAHTCQFAAAENHVDVPAIQLLIGPLADNGGFTQTAMPSRSSPLVDAGASTWCGIANAIFGATDQRRYLRPADGIDCDVGAVETDALSDTIFTDGFE